MAWVARIALVCSGCMTAISTGTPMLARSDDRRSALRARNLPVQPHVHACAAKKNGADFSAPFARESAFDFGYRRRRAKTPKPASPEPNNHIAAGTGTGVAVTITLSILP